MVVVVPSGFKLGLLIRISINLVIRVAVAVLLFLDPRSGIREGYKSGSGIRDLTSRSTVYLQCCFKMVEFVFYYLGTGTVPGMIHIF
jgi:hypothetical protein